MKDCFYIKTKNKKDLLEVEEFLHSVGYIWCTGLKYEMLKYGDVNYLDKGITIFIGYDDSFEMTQTLLPYKPDKINDKDFTPFEYPEDFLKIKEFLKERPSYEPRKLIRE